MDVATFSEREESHFSTLRSASRCVDRSLSIDFRQPRKRGMLFVIEEHAHVCVCAPFSRQGHAGLHNHLINSECQYLFDELKRRATYLVASKSICNVPST